MEKNTRFSIRRWLVIGLLPLALWTLACGLFGWLAWTISPWWLFFPSSFYVVGIIGYLGGVKVWQVYQKSKALQARVQLEQHKLRIANFFGPSSEVWSSEEGRTGTVTEQGQGDQG